MEKQAQETQPGSAAMPVHQPLTPERKQWPILIGALAVLGLGAFVAVKAFSPSSVAETPAANPAMEIAIQPVTTSTGSSVSTSSQPLMSESDASLAPYLQTEQSQTIALPAASGPMPITYSTNESVAMPELTMAQSAPSYSADQTVAPAAGNLAPSDDSNNTAPTPESPAAIAASQINVAMASTEQESAPQAPPAPRTPPDKSYLDKTTFKLGRQADSSKDQDVSHWVNLFSNEMSAGNYEQASSHLSKLQSKLPAQSITLLRMQAWYSVDTSDDDTARGLFLRIIDRVPDDQNAGVNIALIDWRAKRFSAALARIDRLYQIYPDSSLVSQNWRSMHDQRR